MTDKPSRSEEEYFARQEAELRKSRKDMRRKTLEQVERKTHYMKCPKCGASLLTEDYHGVEVDRCGECKGVWFDAGEVEQLIKDDSAAVGFLRSIFRGVSS